MMKKLMAAALVTAAWAGTANAAVTYQIDVDTSSQAGRSGYIQLDFGSGCPNCDTTQKAYAAASGFKTDGAATAFDLGDERNDLAQGTGSFTGTVLLDNYTGTPASVLQKLAFGSTLSFLVSLSGPAVDAPLNTNANVFGLNSFYVSFYDADITQNLFAGAGALATAALHVQEDGSVLAVANPDALDATKPTGGTSFASLQQVSAVPEPATWAMMVLGFGMVGAGLRRRKVKVAFA